MSIGWFDSITSGFHQQPLPSTSGIEGEGSVTTEGVIHQWDVNDFVVFLIKEQGSLKYKTTDRDQKEICTNCIEISEEDNLEEMISYLKRSAVMVRDNGFVNFCSIYKTWEMNDAEESIDINLVCGPEGLAWNIFKKSTNENCFLDFQKTTIPSLQCHPETITLIEKIKTETFDNMPLLYCLMRDFKVRVTDAKELKTNFNKEQEKFLEFQKNYRMFSTFPRVYTGIYPYISYGSAYLFRKNIISVGTFANKLFSNRILGTTAGLFAGFYSFCFFGSLFPCLYWLRNYYSFIVSDTICKKEKALQENTSTLPEDSLLIEIEPISSPSRIDKRMGVSKFMWAVTLITHKGSEGNHAKIIVEGINDGFYSSENPRVKNGETIGYGKKFTYMTEFNPPIKSKIFSEKEELLYETRTEIWMKNSNEVKKMLENIEEEKRINSIKFKFFGASSIFYIFGSKPYHNCFTWARKHLKTLNIDLGKGYMDAIGAIVKGYTIDKEEYETDLPALQLL